MVSTNRAPAAARSPAFAFARHETFHLRHGWLFKGLQAVRNDPNALYGNEAHHHLGIGINMLRSLLYWVQATSLVEPIPDGPRFRPPLQLTELGQLVQEHDPYLEDLGTLWALHLELASNRPLATFWYWTFNELPQREITEDRLVQGVQQYLIELGINRVALQSLKKDARCLLRTYSATRRQDRGAYPEDTLDCPLAHLQLLEEGADPGQYRFQVGWHSNLPLDLFTYALYLFRDRGLAGEVAATLEDLRWAPFSPGRLLCLDSATILELLEELQRDSGYARLTRTAGLSVVSLDRDVRAIDILREYYRVYEGVHG